MSEFQNSTIFVVNDSVFGLAIAFLVLTSLATLSRFVIRARSKLSFGADDWWIILALLTYHGCLEILLYSKQIPLSASELI